MQFKLIVFIIVIIILAALGWYFYNQAIIEEFPRASGDAVFYEISEIKTKNLTPGIYQTQGYVVKIYTCPACPPPKQCKPCMGDNIVISQENKILDNYNLTPNDLIIFTQTPEIFELGKKYQFTIRLTETKSTSEPINDLELVSFEFLEG